MKIQKITSQSRRDLVQTEEQRLRYGRRNEMGDEVEREANNALRVMSLGMRKRVTTKVANDQVEFQEGSE